MDWCPSSTSRTSSTLTLSLSGMSLEIWSQLVLSLCLHSPQILVQFCLLLPTLHYAHNLLSLSCASPKHFILVFNSVCVLNAWLGRWGELRIWVQGLWRPAMLHFLGLEVQVVVSCPVWVLETKLRSSTRAAHPPNHSNYWAISQPCKHLIFIYLYFVHT